MRWVPVVLLFVVACSTTPSAITRDDLKSELKIAQSYTAMANLLIGQHRQMATTSTFDSVHLHYIVDQVRSEIQSLSRQRPTPGLETAYQTCLDSFKELDTLAAPLERHSSDSVLANTLASRTAAMMPALERAIATL